MALGKPAIPTPNALELRGIANAISNIRQRIEAAEAAIAIASGTANQAGSSTTTTLSTLRGAVSALDARVSALEAAGTTDTTTLTAAAAISLYGPVVPAGPGQCKPADPNDPLSMFGLIGIATGAAAVGNTVAIQRRGPLTVTTAAFEHGRAVYAGDGGLTQFPSYESTAIPVGVATGTTSMWVAPDWPALSESIFASGLGDDFLRYLPVTYQIVRDAVLLLESFNAQPDGFLVKVGENLVASRVLVAGSGNGITIENADGVDGDPLFTVP